MDPITGLMRALKEDIHFVQSKILEIHRADIEEAKTAERPIKWNTDFDGHWENLFECVISQPGYT